MKRAPLTHDMVFAGEFAAEYARKHRGIAEKFGRECAQKLAARGFRDGKIIDVGCGFGATAIVLAQRFPDSEIVGIDLFDSGGSHCPGRPIGVERGHFLVWSALVEVRGIGAYERPPQADIC